MTGASADCWQASHIDFGDSALYLSMGIWAKDLTGSNAAAGLVFLAMGVPYLAAPLAGHLTDRVRRKPLLAATNAFSAMAVLLLLDCCLTTSSLERLRHLAGGPSPR